MSTEHDEEREAAYYGNGRAKQARRNTEFINVAPERKRRSAEDLAAAAVAGVLIMFACIIVLGLMIWAAVWIWSKVL